MANNAASGMRTGSRRDEREFLPAALEVLETPVSPTGRAMMFVIIAFFTLGLAWAAIGKVDIIATAPGRILPVGKVKLIQPFDPGTIRAIHVQDGDHVQAGQLLVELDPTDASADQVKLVHDLELADLDVARLTALKKSAETGGAPSPLVIPQNASGDDVAQVRAALRSQVDSQAAKIAALDQQIAEKKGEQAEVAAATSKINASLPLLTEKERLHQDLHDRGYGTTFSYLDSQEALSDAQHDLEVEAQKGVQAQAAEASLKSQRAQAVSDYAAGILSDLAKAEEKANELREDLVKAQQTSSGTQLRAPISGVVEQLAVHTIGGVVTPAQELMTVVPTGGALNIEAQLANRDVGFVHAGQDASIKVETYNFTRYGLLRGKVFEVSRDTVAQADSEAGRLPGATGAQGASPPPGSGTPTYVARISLDRTTMLIDGSPEPLIPGMAVTVEIKTGRRSILSYLLSPIARKASEAMHER